MGDKFDKFWWWRNRKPSGRITLYFTFAVPWVFVGSLLVASLITFLAGPVWQGIGFLTLFFLLSWVYYQVDASRGYVDALYKAYLKRREEVGRRLGKL